LPLLPRKLLRNIRDYGLGVSFLKIFSSCLKPVFETRSYLLYVVDLSGVEDKEPAPIPGVTFRFIDASESAIIAQIETIEDWLWGTVAAKLQKGYKCLTALRGDKVIGFNLIGFDIFCLPLIKLAKPLRPVECFSEQISVHPEFRKEGIGTALRSRIFAAMKKEGYHRMYGGTQLTNTANKALTRKVGFKEFAVVRYLKIFGYKHDMVYRIKKCS
jgi:GNAT superfamily N-acetyltransferase